MNALTADVAQRIVVRTMAVIGRNVNVMDDRGLILAAGDPARRGSAEAPRQGATRQGRTKGHPGWP